MSLFIAILTFLISFSLSSSTIHPDPLLAANVAPVPAARSGNTNCSTASSDATFQLTFISYGNWTALPSQDENPIQRLESVSFAVYNAANVMSTVCAFSLGVTLSGDPGVLDNLTLSTYPLSFTGVSPRAAVAATSGVGEWQACADRKDTDGKHRFTIATGAVFRRADKSLAVNQTWFCHDDAGRLVAFTGVANTVLNLTCSESEVSEYRLQNCTSTDLVLPVTLL
ncbi:hypothetical protein E0Z10_g7677 [Xylaria hypoxylon]|uniref:AA1-like domain-containing protein n=1 Tax=Xylaria hypoxylon TaxID=37992 RepID=A0A4Z0YPH1_9PEZI|nr:hypothetical protein E0Z10_g7677 [Xylaria hypoxylon]